MNSFKKAHLGNTKSLYWNVKFMFFPGAGKSGVAVLEEISLPGKAWGLPEENKIPLSNALL